MGRVRSIAPFLVLAALCCTVLPRTGFGQNTDVLAYTEASGGKLYYIAFPDTTANTFDVRYPAALLNSSAFTLLIYSPVDQKARIGRMNGAKEEVVLSAGEILEFNTENVGVPLITVINQPQTNVLQIESEQPIIVYAYMGTAFGTAAFTPIPVEGWGQEYYAATWPGEVVRDVSPETNIHYRATAKEAPGEILIVAAYDNTQVTIKATAQLRECNGCQNVQLNAGQAYLVQSIVDTSSDAEFQDDLGGTQITANKPIGVISGNTRVMHNSGVRPSLAENSFKDLVAEWLPPIEQHGTEFVFTHTWDDRRQREGLDLEESRDAELVRIYATSQGKTSVQYRDELGRDIPSTKPELTNQGFVEEMIGVTVARYYRTGQPAYAVMSPHSVVKFNGTTTWGANYVGASYGAWSTYMVELVPTERWTSFAPFRAPSWPPAGMKHYLNVVADTNGLLNVYLREEGGGRTPFQFNRGRILGTRFAWGTMEIDAGVSYFLEGENRARFTGHVYGMLGGYEESRPHGRTKDVDGKGASVNGSGQASVQHVLPLAELVDYEENLALAYGYPLPSARCIPGDPDEYEIQALKEDCGEMTVTIRALTANSVGLQSLQTLSDSSENVRLEFVNPSNPADILGSEEVEVRLVPINPKKNSSAVLIITDRTCNSNRWRVEYNSEAVDQVQIAQTDGVDFGNVAVDKSAGERPIVITNPLVRSIHVKRLRFLLGNQGFEITRTEPDFAWGNGRDSLELGPDDSLTVWVDITPRNADREYNDSLVVELGCGRELAGLHAETAEACLFVSNLDFGQVLIGVEKTLPLHICNVGQSAITFKDPFLTWLNEEFHVEEAELAKLAQTTLGPDECVTIMVTFVSEIPGASMAEAKVWPGSGGLATSGNCRDVSVWRANVVDSIISGVAGDKLLAGYKVSSVTPNPTSGKTILTFQLGHSGVTTVKVYDTEGRVIATLADERLGAGEHRVEWDGAGQPSGTYYIRIQSGEWTGTASLVKVH